jgi:hypothetical protein
MLRNDIFAALHHKSRQHNCRHEIVLKIKPHIRSLRYIASAMTEKMAGTARPSPSKLLKKLNL